MDEDAPEPSKQFSIRSLFRWTLLVALVIVLIQRLGNYGTISLIVLVATLVGLSGSLVMLFTGVFWVSIVSTPDDHSSEQLSKCRALMLIGLAMCAPLAIVIIFFFDYI